jgi:hypothetical protein
MSSLAQEPAPRRNPVAEGEIDDQPAHARPPAAGAQLDIDGDGFWSWLFEPEADQPEAGR